MKIEGFAPLIQVFDMPTSVAFYRDVLGFAVVSTSPPRGRDDFDWAMLRLDDVELMLNTRYEFDDRPPAPDPARVAAHDDTALYFGCRDLDAASAHLRARGVEPEARLTATVLVTPRCSTGPPGRRLRAPRMLQEIVRDR